MGPGFYKRKIVSIGFQLKNNTKIYFLTLVDTIGKIPKFDERNIYKI